MHVNCRMQIKCNKCQHQFPTVASLSKHKHFCNVLASTTVHHHHHHHQSHQQQQQQQQPETSAAFSASSKSASKPIDLQQTNFEPVATNNLRNHQTHNTSVSSNIKHSNNKKRDFFNHSAQNIDDLEQHSAAGDQVANQFNPFSDISFINETNRRTGHQLKLLSKVHEARNRIEPERESETAATATASINFNEPENPQSHLEQATLIAAIQQATRQQQQQGSSNSTLGNSASWTSEQILALLLSASQQQQQPQLQQTTSPLVTRQRHVPHNPLDTSVPQIDRLSPSSLVSTPVQQRSTQGVSSQQQIALYSSALAAALSAAVAFQDQTNALQSVSLLPGLLASAGSVQQQSTQHQAQTIRHKSSNSGNPLPTNPINQNTQEAQTNQQQQQQQLLTSLALLAGLNNFNRPSL